MASMIQDLQDEIEKLKDENTRLARIIADRNEAIHYLQDALEHEKAENGHWRNLVAVLCGDGGHYHVQHGTEATKAFCQERFVGLMMANDRLDEMNRELRAVVAKLPKYADTGEPIVRGAEVWVDHGPHISRECVRAVFATSVLLEYGGGLSHHQRHLWSTKQAADAARAEAALESRKAESREEK